MKIREKKKREEEKKRRKGKKEKQTIRVLKNVMQEDRKEKTAKTTYEYVLKRNRHPLHGLSNTKKTTAVARDKTTRRR